jgi:antitoxin MazE
MLEEAGLEEHAEIALKRGAIVLRKPRRNPRQGWAEASHKVAEAGDDRLIWPEFANQGGGDLEWQLRTLDKVRLVKRLGSVSSATLASTLESLQKVFA